MKNTALPEIRKTVVLPAPIEIVWQVVSTADGLGAWWMPNTFRPELGREFVIHAGPYGDSPGKVTEWEPMTKVGFDWDQDWHLTLLLKPLGDKKTELTLIHSGFNQEKSTIFGQPHAIVRKTMEGGWEKIIKEKLPSVIKSLIDGPRNVAPGADG